MEVFSLQKVAENISKLKCAQHGESVIATAEEGAISYVNVCCEPFKEKVNEEIQKEIDMQIRGGFDNLFGKK